jgi:hypothetical protein
MFNNLQIDTVTNNILNMVIFDKMKIGNPIIDMIVTSICLSLITILIKKMNIYYTNFDKNLNIIDLIYKKNIIKYQGIISISNSSYDSSVCYSSSFSDSFKSLWYFIIKNIENNKSINEITEYIVEHKNINYELINASCYMVTQKNKFIICEKLDIYAQVMVETSSRNDDKSIMKHQHDTITIYIFSYKSDINTIKEYIDNLTNTYLALLENCRKNKLYIYTLLKGVFERNKYEIWDEVHFLSTRSFSNIFFKEKNDIIKKIDFFLHNKQWYYDKGIPYSLGIGTYGPPGTGKTSLIKSIANHTNRNIIVISLKMIKTKIQLNNIFFEEFYNANNKNNIGFDKKIIVFEDIDCVGNIVLNRNDKKDIDFVISEKINEKMCENAEEDFITLDDILNLWDGIRETSGRIIIISSNHYDKLDPALIRPGRIDITLELSYVSHSIIKDMYKHFFEEEIDDNILQNIKENFYTPAEITNIYMNSNHDKNIFIEKILQNIHI